MAEHLTRETAILYLDDALSPADEGVVEAHLTGCSVCRAVLSESAGSDADWTMAVAALRNDELDCDSSQSVPPLNWALSLLGPTDDPRMLGRIGPFEVGGCIGIGGMGVVFKARDPALDRYVAVKLLSPQLAASDHARKRFAREARAAAAVLHDNIIAIYQVAEHNGLPYLVMPYVPGPSLEQRLQRRGPMAPVEALRVARQVAAGLQAAHAEGLIHRDIKPANILLSGDTERAVITDFGLARAADDATLTRSGTLAGTPQFMAPEQARGEPADERSDLFSLGALLFAMLTGRAPVEGLSGAETVRIVGSRPPLSVSSQLADCPKSLARLVDRLSAFRPQDRTTSAAEALQLISECREMPDAGPLKPIGLRSRHHVATSSQYRLHRTALFSALLVVGTAAVLWAFSRNSASSSQSPSDVLRSGVPDNQFAAPSPAGQEQQIARDDPNTSSRNGTEITSAPERTDTPPATGTQKEAVAGAVDAARVKALLEATGNQRLDDLLHSVEHGLDDLEQRYRMSNQLLHEHDQQLPQTPSGTNAAASAGTANRQSPQDLPPP